MITNLVNPRSIGGASIARSFRNDSKETISSSRKIDKVMDVQASLRDMCKKRRIDVGPMNVVINSEEEADSRRLKYHYKRRVDHVGPFTMIVATPTSPLTSLPSITHASSSVTAHGIYPSFAPTCFPPSSLSLIEEPLA